MKRIRALVVDDDSGLLDSLCEGLRMENWDVQSANNGSSALERLETQSFDVIVSDMNMPGMDGLGVLRQVRKANRDIIFVLMSGYADVPIWECFMSGANEILGKPFRFQELEDLVRRMKMPMWERWGNRSRELEGRIANHIEVSQGDGSFSLGRGGLFLASQELKGFSRAQIVSFRLASSHIFLEGIGKIRWKRPASSSELAGIGIEFLYLDERCRKLVIHLIEQSREVALIPAGLAKSRL